MCVVSMTVPGVTALQLLLYALLLGVEFVPDDLRNVRADLVLQEALALTHVVQPVVLGQAEQLVPLNVAQPCLSMTNTLTETQWSLGNTNTPRLNGHSAIQTRSLKLNSHSAKQTLLDSTVTQQYQSD